MNSAEHSCPPNDRSMYFFPWFLFVPAGSVTAAIDAGKTFSFIYFSRRSLRSHYFRSGKKMCRLHNDQSMQHLQWSQRNKKCSVFLQKCAHRVCVCICVCLCLCAIAQYGGPDVPRQRVN